MLLGTQSDFVKKKEIKCFQLVSILSVFINFCCQNENIKTVTTSNYYSGKNIKYEAANKNCLAVYKKKYKTTCSSINSQQCVGFEQFVPPDGTHCLAFLLFLPTDRRVRFLKKFT